MARHNLQPLRPALEALQDGRPLTIEDVRLLESDEMAKLALRPLPAKRLREAVALLRLEWEETQRLEKAQRKLANDPRRKVGLNGPAIGHAVQPPHRGYLPGIKPPPMQATGKRSRPADDQPAAADDQEGPRKRSRRCGLPAGLWGGCALPPPAGPGGLGFRAGAEAGPGQLRLLRQVFGRSAFRPGQAKLIQHAATGVNSLGIMPQGGRALCYQMAALAVGGLTIVLSSEPTREYMKTTKRLRRQEGVLMHCISSVGSQPPAAVGAAVRRGGGGDGYGGKGGGYGGKGGGGGQFGSGKGSGKGSTAKPITPALPPAAQVDKLDIRANRAAGGCCLLFMSIEMLSLQSLAASLMRDMPDLLVIMDADRLSDKSPTYDPAYAAAAALFAHGVAGSSRMRPVQAPHSSPSHRLATVMALAPAASTEVQLDLRQALKIGVEGVVKAPLSCENLGVSVVSNPIFGDEPAHRLTELGRLLNAMHSDKSQHGRAQSVVYCCLPTATVRTDGKAHEPGSSVGLAREWAGRSVASQPVEVTLAAALTTKGIEARALHADMTARDHGQLRVWFCSTKRAVLVVDSCHGMEPFETRGTSDRTTFVDAAIQHGGQQPSSSLVRAPHNMDHPPTNGPNHLGLCYNMAPLASNGPNHLGLCALQWVETAVSHFVWGLPSSPEAFGVLLSRAARPGRPGHCTVLVAPAADEQAHKLHAATCLPAPIKVQPFVEAVVRQLQHQLRGCTAAGSGPVAQSELSTVVEPTGLVAGVVAGDGAGLCTTLTLKPNEAEAVLNFLARLPADDRAAGPVVGVPLLQEVGVGYELLHLAKVGTVEPAPLAGWQNSMLAHKPCPQDSAWMHGAPSTEDDNAQHVHSSLAPCRPRTPQAAHQLQGFSWLTLSAASAASGARPATTPSAIAAEVLRLQASGKLRMPNEDGATWGHDDTMTGTRYTRYFRLLPRAGVAESDLPAQAGSECRTWLVAVQATANRAIERSAQLFAAATPQCGGRAAAAAAAADRFSDDVDEGEGDSFGGGAGDNAQLDVALGLAEKGPLEQAIEADEGRINDYEGGQSVDPRAFAPGGTSMLMTIPEAECPTFPAMGMTEPPKVGPESAPTPSVAPPAPPADCCFAALLAAAVELPQSDGRKTCGKCGWCRRREDAPWPAAESLVAKH